CCRRRSCGDGLFVGLARLAQVDVNIDQARRDDEASGVDRLCGLNVLQGAGFVDCGDSSITKQKVAGLVEAVGRIDHAAIQNQYVTHTVTLSNPPALRARSSSAERTERPLLTCSSIAELG